jgi:hypothetical protein
VLYADRPACESAERVHPRGQRGRPGGWVDPPGVRERHRQSWPGRERSRLGCAADFERRSRANNSGESPTVDNYHRSDDNYSDDDATDDYSADLEEGSADAKEGTAEARCAARGNSDTRIAELHRIAVDEPSLCPSSNAEAGAFPVLNLGRLNVGRTLPAER